MKMKSFTVYRDYEYTRTFEVEAVSEEAAEALVEQMEADQSSDYSETGHQLANTTVEEEG